MNKSNLNLLIKDRGAGKTTGLIHASEATGYPIVVSTGAYANQIRDRAKELGAIIPEPLIIDAVRRRGLRLPENILIDEVQDILSEALDSYMGTHVVGVTMTDNKKECKKLLDKKKLDSPF